MLISEAKILMKRRLLTWPHKVDKRSPETLLSSDFPRLTMGNLSPVEYNTYKGISIFLVVLGHNSVLINALGSFHIFLYFFHVSLFLYMPFFKPIESWSRKHVGALCFRYLWPMAVFTVIYALIFRIVESSEMTALAFASMVSTSIFAMSARAFDAATGLQLLWFLPALAGIHIAMLLFSRVPRAWLLPLVLGILVAHLSVGLLPEKYRYFTPFGWPIVAFSFPLGVGINYVLRFFPNQPVALVYFLITAAFFLISIYLLSSGLYFNIGYLVMPSVSEPLLLLGIDTLQVFAVVLMLSLSKHRYAQFFFRKLGEHSLEIYMFHQVVFSAAFIASKKYIALNDTPIFGVVLLAISVFGPLIGAGLLHKLPSARTLIFPTDLRSLLSVFRLSHPLGRVR